MSDEGTADDRAAGDGREDTSAGGDVAEKRYDVYVQWKRGEPHQHAESIRASDVETALMLAKRNVDVRLDPLSLRVTPRAATAMTKLGDTTVSPSTDRSYRNVEGYFTRETNPPGGRESSDD